jgi:maltooligosyltrehalose synthase
MLPDPQAAAALKLLAPGIADMYRRLTRLEALVTDPTLLS